VMPETGVSNTEDSPSSTSRRLAMTSGAALLGTRILGGMSANAQPAGTPASAPPAGSMPQGYNILFVLDRRCGQWCARSTMGGERHTR
jgi:hypothetical protein